MAETLSAKVQKIAATVCRREGHRSQARILDIVKVIGIIEDLRYASAETALTLNQLGISREKRQAKK
jgi:acid phosphatase family membrane protein YuiD